MPEISVLPVPFTVRALPPRSIVPTNGEKVTGVVCPGLTIADRYIGSNRQRGSIGVIDQNAGTEHTEGTDVEDRAGVGRERDVLNDTGRHVQSADSSTCGEIGLIDECAVEEGGIAGAWRTPKGSSYRNYSILLR